MHFIDLQMRIKVLGSAAGGGLPQWNCSCGNCSAARAGTIPRRHVASLAVTGDETQWVLVNASGDIGAQLAATRELAPQAKRRSPVGTLALTDANIDHVAGLLEFRQAGELSIYSSALVKETLCASPMFAQFAQLQFHCGRPPPAALPKILIRIPQPVKCMSHSVAVAHALWTGSLVRRASAQRHSPDRPSPRLPGIQL